MKQKKRSHYGDYCEIRGKDIYGRVYLRKADGTNKLTRKKVGSKIEARQWALEKLHEVEQTSSTKFRTVAELLVWYKDAYLIAPVFENGHKVTGVKDWQRLRSKVDRICGTLGGTQLASLTEHDLHQYAKSRRDRDKVTTATLNRDFALLRSAFNKARPVDRSVPLLKFPVNSNAEVERDRVLSPAEEVKLLAACVAVEDLEYTKNGKPVKTTKHLAKRDHLRPILLLAVDTGLRTKELLSLTWLDVDLASRVIQVRSTNTKTQKARKVGITARVYDELSPMQQTTGKLFDVVSVRRSFKTACRRADIVGLRFHDLRHTATTRMIRAGVPHTEVMKITGHTQMKTFLRYLNLVNDTVQNAATLLDQFNGGV